MYITASEHIRLPDYLCLRPSLTHRQSAAGILHSRPRPYRKHRRPQPREGSILSPHHAKHDALRLSLISHTSASPLNLSPLAHRQGQAIPVISRLPCKAEPKG